MLADTTSAPDPRNPPCRFPPAPPFDPARAHEYAEQSRIALAGYDACHELTACMLASAIAAPDARILVAGAGGTGQEICVAAALEPGWQFTAVDPSAPMLALARSNVEAAGFGARTAFVEDGVDALPDTPAFDGATLIGVLHHVPGDEAKAALLHDRAAPETRRAARARRQPSRATRTTLACSTRGSSAGA